MGGRAGYGSRRSYAERLCVALLAALAGCPTQLFSRVSPTPALRSCDFLPACRGPSQPLAPFFLSLLAGQRPKVVRLAILSDERSPLRSWLFQLGFTARLGCWR